MIDQVLEMLKSYAEDTDGYTRYFHGASREAHDYIQAHGFCGRVEESDLQYTNGDDNYIYVAPFHTADQCFEYAGERGAIYLFEYSGEGSDDVRSNGSGSEYLLPVPSSSFRVFGHYDLLSQELVVEE